MERDKIRHVGDSLVAIEPGWSAGFFVRDDLILTAGHCLRDRPHKVEIHLRNGQVICGKILEVHHADVGFISVDPSSHNQPSLPTKAIKNFSPYIPPVFVTLLMKERNHNGHPFEFEQGVYEGKFVSGFWAEKMLYMKLHSRQGFSGAPIICNNHAVGVLVGKERNSTVAIPIELHCIAKRLGIEYEQNKISVLW